MRVLRLTLLSLLVAGTLVAQAPRRYADREPLPLLQTVTFDAAAALQERWRVAMEPLIFGRFTVGLSGTFTTEPDLEWPPPWPIPLMEAGSPTIPCYIDYCPPYLGDAPRYRAWSMNLHARWYPAALSLGGDRQRVGVYVGEFLGYHERRITWRQTAYRTQYPPYTPVDTVIPPPDTLPQPYDPYPYPIPGYSWVQKLRGWEPGAEAGVRVMMGRHVVIDVGGWFRLATIEDPLSTTRPGDVDARFVAAVGIGW
jgi:hypothetical protein